MIGYCRIVRKRWELQQILKRVSKPAIWREFKLDLGISIAFARTVPVLVKLARAYMEGIKGILKAVEMADL